MTNINIYDSTYKMVHNISYNTRDDMAEILEEAVIEYVKNHDLQDIARGNRSPEEQPITNKGGELKNGRAEKYN